MEVMKRKYSAPPGSDDGEGVGWTRDTTRQIAEWLDTTQPASRHLLLIGGHNDVLIESGFAAASARSIAAWSPTNKAATMPADAGSVTCHSIALRTFCRRRSTGCAHVAPSHCGGASLAPFRT